MPRQAGCPADRCSFTLGMCRLQCGKMDQVQCPSDRCEWSGSACQPLAVEDLPPVDAAGAAAEAAASEASDAAADADAAAEAAEASSADAAASSADAAASASEADAAAAAAEAAEAAVEDAEATAAAQQQSGEQAVPPGDVPAEAAAPKPAPPEAEEEPTGPTEPALPPAPRLPPGPSCAGFKAKGTCPADRCIWGGWFCQPLATGRKPDGSNFGACEKVKTEADCASTGGDGVCRCTFGVHPLGKKFKRPGSKICSPNPTFGTATDTCTPPGYRTPPSDFDAAAAADAAADEGTSTGAGAGSPAPPPPATDCMVFKAKGTCPADRCMWGGWFCQPVATGALPDGGSFGACEKVRTD